jgi:hypothetical protein
MKRLSPHLRRPHTTLHACRWLQVATEIAAAAKDVAGKLQEMDARWRSHATALTAAHDRETAATAEAHAAALAAADVRASAAEQQLQQREAEGQLAARALAALSQQCVELLGALGAADAAAAVAAGAAAAAEQGGSCLAAAAAEVQVALTACTEQADALSQQLQERQGVAAAAADALAAAREQLQAVVATVAFHVPLAADVQAGLGAAGDGGGSFEPCLQALHEVGGGAAGGGDA